MRGSGNKASRAAFTLTEVVLAVLISTMVMLAAYALFSQTMKTSIKGTDTTETIRSASSLIADIRRDLLECRTILENPPLPTIRVTNQENTLPAVEMNTGSPEITFSSLAGQVTYSFSPVPGGKPSTVKRTSALSSGGTAVREYAAGRMVSFRVFRVLIDQKVTDDPQDPDLYQNGFLLLDLRLDSQDPRFPSTNLAMTTFIGADQMASSTWVELPQ